MERENLRLKVISGLIWTLAERVLAQGISFIVSIILARLLLPEQYGTISIIIIFISLFNVFVTSGLGGALVQKKNADNIDFSTAFTAGLIISIVFYLFLFLFAPFIEDFYGMNNLSVYIRVLGVLLPLTSVNSVQQAYVSKKLIFRKFFFSTLLGTSLSALIGIYMAYKNFGIWSLIAQYLLNVTINIIVLFFTINWKPELKISKERFNSMFTFGWKILLSDLIQETYNNLRGLAIGKKYTPADLSYYNRGQQFTSLVVSNIDSSIIKVLFPAISTCQDNINDVKNMTRRAIKVSSFLMTPLLLCLLVVSKPLIIILLTPKWVNVVPYLQILCLANLFQPVHSTNLQAIKAIGRSDVNLTLEIIKKFYGVVILIISIVFFDNPFYVAVGFVISTFISVIVHAIASKKMLNYSISEQARDVLPHLFIGIVASLIGYIIGLKISSLYVTLITQIITILFIYIFISSVFKVESLNYIINQCRTLTSSLLMRKNK